ncbi:hypothetical protein RRG08_017096 [Elysia crispata]|uniref:Uncharacterized protein n=1 Tax=Elysia crispata TaxID=231223 RepID=A0AAE1DJ19_9GAST|nr:hypothetical protein RRG08_017096 [Elysia crispata]
MIFHGDVRPANTSPRDATTLIRLTEITTASNSNVSSSHNGHFETNSFGFSSGVLSFDIDSHKTQQPEVIPLVSASCTSSSSSTRRLWKQPTSVLDVVDPSRSTEVNSMSAAVASSEVVKRNTAFVIYSVSAKLVTRL